MRNRLNDKVAFATGAGSGIEKAAAAMFSREGAKIAVVEIDPELGRATERMVREGGVEALFIQTDVTQDDGVDRAVTATVERYGKFDTLFN